MLYLRQIKFFLQTYFVSVFGVARDRRSGSLLATGSVRPRTSTAKRLRENVPYKAEIKGKSVYYLKVNKSNLTKLFFLFRFTLYAAHNRLTGETWERSVKNSRFIVSAEYVFF